MEWALFIGTFLGTAVWETFLPRQKSEWSVARRWGGHALLYAISGIASSVVFRSGAVALAAAVSGSRYGLLNKPGLPLLFRFLLALTLMDLVRYGTHRLFHSVAFLWRIHEVHHSDPDYDVSTAVRFHPLEAMLDQAIFLAAVWILAPSPAAVFLSQLMTAGVNLFAHANASLPSAVERLLNTAIVTPDVHRIHHSAAIDDQSHNFGQTFSWWDRLFGTWRARRSEKEFAIGIEGLRDERTIRVAFMLREPFLSQSRSRSEPS